MVGLPAYNPNICGSRWALPRLCQFFKIFTSVCSLGGQGIIKSHDNTGQSLCTIPMGPGHQNISPWEISLQQLTRRWKRDYMGTRPIDSPYSVRFTNFTEPVFPLGPRAQPQQMPLPSGGVGDMTVGAKFSMTMQRSVPEALVSSAVCCYCHVSFPQLPSSSRQGGRIAISWWTLLLSQQHFRLLNLLPWDNHEQPSRSCLNVSPSPFFSISTFSPFALWGNHLPLHHCCCLSGALVSISPWTLLHRLSPSILKNRVRTQAFTIFLFPTKQSLPWACYLQLPDLFLFRPLQYSCKSNINILYSISTSYSITLCNVPYVTMMPNERAFC